MQAATRILQSPVRHNKVDAHVRIQSKRGAARKTAPSICAPAFLTKPIDAIRPSDETVVSSYGIDVKASYECLIKCCKRFSSVAGLNFKFMPNKDFSKSQNLGLLIDYFEELIKPLGISFCVSKLTPRGENTDLLSFVVYRYGRELEDTIVILYVSPAKYLSPEGSKIFKRFMKFFHDCTNIPLGVNQEGENFYLDSILNMWEDDPFYECEDNEDDEYDEHKSIALAYREDGEFWNLFDEIGGMPVETAESLSEDIMAYRKVCPVDELDLIEVLYEGIDIVKDMNYYWYEFNPDDDGFPEGGDGYDDAGWASGVFSSAILYSEQDGIGEELLDSINSEVSSGIMMSGWNIHQYLYPNMKRDVIADFIRCKDKVAEFDSWLCRYSRQVEKFDKYGKLESNIE